MRKIALHTVLIGFCLLSINKSFSQTQQTFEQIGYLLNDALFYSDKYVTPATDAAVYQASSNWVLTSKKKKLWEVTLSLHSNLFFVPHRDREFDIQNSDFSFFQIENATSATVPTALGNSHQVYLTGDIDGNQVRLKTPEGIDQETVFYPYLQGSIGLWKGTEFVAKYSTKVKLKKGDYQVYGFGLKHNLSQYFKSMEAKKINFSALVAYSKEEVSFDFLDVQTTYGNLGLNQISGLVDTWQFQVNASKEYKKFEFMTGLISNVSNFIYEVGGPKGEIEQIIPLQSLINTKLKDIYKTKTNFMGEVSCRYQISKLYAQTTIAFGKFVNTNVSLQYEF